MAGEPSEEDVQSFIDFTLADRTTAIRYLKVKDNDLPKAVNALLEGEDISSAENATSWDDTAWSADREGGAVQGPHNFAYNEGNLRPLGHSAAPTRGSSPVPSLKHPSTKAEEDAEMEQALAASRQDLGYEGQETGIVGQDGKTSTTFGPATGSAYDPSKWAMTVSGVTDAHETSEVIPDLDATDRQHQEGQPRYLKQLTSGDYLPNFLTIAHSIPLARETLLMRSFTRTTYGEDSDWWKGHSIRLPRIVHVSDGSVAEPATTQQEEIVTEVQRLMAFLDASNRSYGSADSLACLAQDYMQRSQQGSETLLDHTLRTWQEGAMSVDKSDTIRKDVFHSIIGTNSEHGLNTPDMWLLPLNVTISEGSSGPTATLAEVMDGTLWDTDPDDEAFCDTYMERCADVLPMRVSQTDRNRDTLGIIIPPVLYVDKYLKENVESTRVVRKEMANVKKRMNKVEAIQAKIKGFKQPGKRETMDSSVLVNYVLGHFTGENRKAVLEDREARGMDIGADLPELPAHYPDVAAKLEAVCKSINTKLAVLEQEKEKSRHMLARLSQSAPPGLEGGVLRHRYTLRGVSTKPHVTYVLRPKSDTADQGPDADMFSDGDAPEGMQWWRIEYDVTFNGPKTLVTRSTEDDVLRAVELEHNQALLVYASDNAINHPESQETSQVLQEFIRIDNSYFAAELSSHQQPMSQMTAFPPPPEEDAPRRSIESTTVNWDEETEPDPPMYSSQPTYDYNDDSTALLGTQQTYSEHSSPAHEIKLDDVDEGHEMMERSHSPLMGGMSSDDRAGRRTSDVAMPDAGESQHVEDLDNSKVD